jgi:hypothetical protein
MYSINGKQRLAKRLTVMKTRNKAARGSQRSRNQSNLPKASAQRSGAPNNSGQHTHYRENSLTPHGRGDILAILRLALSRKAPSYSLRMTGGTVLQAPVKLLWRRLFQQPSGEGCFFVDDRARRARRGLFSGLARAEGCYRGRCFLSLPPRR